LVGDAWPTAKGSEFYVSYLDLTGDAGSSGVAAPRVAEMNRESDVGPPSCQFNTANLVLRVDELVASEIEAISPVVDKLMKAIRESDCAPGNEYDVELALREALANAILHGNRQDPRKKVRICCACQAGGGILIVVKDEGEGFDPAKIPNPLVGENILAEHGRGIYLINLLIDQVHFERGGTEIHMRKG
jgi:serine/threonine-protein kinase RsbW